MKQRTRKGHQALLAVLEQRQLIFPLPFLLLFLLLDASQTPFAAGHRGGVDLGMNMA